MQDILIIIGAFMTVYILGLTLHEATHAVVANYYTDVNGVAVMFEKGSYLPTPGAFVSIEESNNVISFAPAVWLLPGFLLYTVNTPLFIFIATIFIFAGAATIFSDLAIHLGIVDVDLTDYHIFPVVEFQPIDRWDLET